jgi:hypothetical protein
LLTNNFVLSAVIYYLINPRETNGVMTYRARETEAIMSVPDQIALRAGLSYLIPVTGLGVYLGGRWESVPVHDLIGGSEGFRRPGTIFSVEPGLSYNFKSLQLNLDVPIALIRNRTQSVPDKETEAMTGNPQHGDAAFTDYLINFGITYRFGGKKHAAIDMDHIEPTPIN